MKKLYFVIALFSLTYLAKAQMPNDAIYMPKGTICIAPMVSQTDWKEYWEGTLLRENYNMGVHTTQTASIMAAYGITNKLNAIVALPYVKTKTSAGNLMGQQGLQDLSLTLKYNVYERKGLSVNGAISISTPVTNYVAEFLPMSIGLKSKTAAPRLIIRYKLPVGLYAQGSVAYVMRRKVKIDKDAYQFDGKVINSNLVAIPNATETKISIGFLRKAWQIEGFIEDFNCVSGDNIRRNDMPFISNQMQATMRGAYFKFQPKKIGINARIAETTSGLNVGKSVNYTGGLLFQF